MLRAAALLLALVACDGVDDDLPEGSDAAPGPSCREQFGDAPAYMPCTSQEGSCAFFTRGGARTCYAICGEGGGECASSFVAVDSCDPDSGDQGCGVPNAAQICVCLP